jgi:hypothetical protein
MYFFELLYASLPVEIYTPARYSHVGIMGNEEVYVTLQTSGSQTVVPVPLGLPEVFSSSSINPHSYT